MLKEKYPTSFQAELIDDSREAVHNVDEVVTDLREPPYQFARRLGETTQAARSHPATGPYLAALDVLGIDPNDPRTHPVATAPQTR